MKKRGAVSQPLIFFAAVIILVVLTGTQTQLLGGTTDVINEEWVYSTCNKVDNEGSFTLQQSFGEACPCDVDNEDRDNYEPKAFELNRDGIDQMSAAFGIPKNVIESEFKNKVSEPDAEAIGYFINENTRTEFTYDELIQFDWFFNSKLGLMAGSDNTGYSRYLRDIDNARSESEVQQLTRNFMQQYFCPSSGSNSVVLDRCSYETFLKYWFGQDEAADERPVAVCKTDIEDCRKEYIDTCGEEDE